MGKDNLFSFVFFPYPILLIFGLPESNDLLLLFGRSLISIRECLGHLIPPNRQDRTTEILSFRSLTYLHLPTC